MSQTTADHVFGFRARGGVTTWCGGRGQAKLGTEVFRCATPPARDICPPGWDLADQLFTASITMPVGVAAAIYRENTRPELGHRIRDHVTNWPAAVDISACGARLFVYESSGPEHLAAVLTLALLILPTSSSRRGSRSAPFRGRSVKPRTRSARRAGRSRPTTCCRIRPAAS